jgi:hypothetical protein
MLTKYEAEIVLLCWLWSLFGWLLVEAIKVVRG